MTSDRRQPRAAARHRAVRPAAWIVAAAVAAGTLAGCGGDSQYCAAVKENVSALDTFGKKKTDKAFTTYRRTTLELAELAPEPVGKDWKALAKAISNVQKAQKAAKLSLEDVSVETVAGLSTEQSQRLDKSYRGFTDAVAEHGGVVKKNVESECGVKLK